MIFPNRYRIVRDSRRDQVTVRPRDRVGANGEVAVVFLGDPRARAMSSATLGFPGGSGAVIYGSFSTGVRGR